MPEKNLRYNRFGRLGGDREAVRISSKNFYVYVLPSRYLYFNSVFFSDWPWNSPTIQVVILPFLELLPPIEVLRLVGSYMISIIFQLKCGYCLSYIRITQKEYGKQSQSSTERQVLIDIYISHFCCEKHHEQGNLWEDTLSLGLGPHRDSTSSW